MAISKISRLLQGVQRGVNLANNDLLVGNIQIKAGSGNDALYATFGALSAFTAVRTINVPDANVDLANIAALVTLSGVAANATTLGEFDGDIIGDNTTIKQALQDLEDAVEEVAGKNEFEDDLFRIVDTGDNDKKLRFDVGGLPVGTETVSISQSINLDNALLTDGSRTMTAALGMGNNKITNLAQPTDDQDAATKKYVDDEISDLDEKVDSLAQGLEPKGSVMLATTAPIADLSDVGSSLSIDGVAVQDGGRVLVKNQADVTENGVYDYDQTEGELIRSADFDGNPSNEVKGGDWVYVEAGDTNAGTSWAVLGQGNKDVGTDEINWTKINKITPVQGGAAITVSADTVSVNVDDETIEIDNDELRVKANGIDDSHIRLRNDQNLRARNQADDADVDILRVNEDDEVEMASFFKTPAAAPTEDYDVANKKYVDDAIAANVDAESLVRIANAGESLGTGLRALRWAKGAETAGRLYLADNDASVEDNFYVAGLIVAANEAAATEVTVVKAGRLLATGHGLTVGLPIFLGASGVLTQTAPSADETAVVRVGIVQDANNIDVEIQVMGVN